MLNLQEAYLSIYSEEEENDEIDEGYVSMQGKPLRRVMTKVRDLSSSSQMIKSDPQYKMLAKRGGATDQDIKNAAAKKEDRADKIISRIGKHDPKAAQEREALNRRTIRVGATTVNNKRLKEEVDVYDLVLEYLMEEGFVDTEEAAVNIMSVMSEEWKETIILEWEMKKMSPKERERYAVALRNLADTQERIRNEKPESPKEEKRKLRTNLRNVDIR